MKKFRAEEDAIGKIKVPLNAMYGSMTLRASTYFQLSSQKTPKSFIKAIGLIKVACAASNSKLKELDPKIATLIEKAGKEYSECKFYEESILDPFQAGAGTPLNMNANEIIANRANQIAGKPLGTYKPVHPNNHVNMAQSTNDVVPTATKVAVLFETEPLLNALEKLIESFDKKAKKYKDQIKVGRTHLQDAVPMTVGQEIGAWRDMLKKDFLNIKDLEKHLEELGLGGNAIGSGINSHPNFKKTVVEELKKLTDLNLKTTENTFETNQSMTPFLNYSAGLRSLAVDLTKIANDLKLLNCGPKAGISEYQLPEVEPGSSIMPGKINPSIPEALEMVCFQIMGNDHAICLGAQRGQLQLNVLAPIIMFNLLWSIELLKNGIEMFKNYCIDRLIVKRKRCNELFENSLCIATALSPYLGYHETALIVNEGLKTGKTIKELVLEKKLLKKEILDKILSAKELTEPRALIKIKP